MKHEIEKIRVKIAEFKLDIATLELEMSKTEDLMHDICNDPMNGCPGDFAEDFDRRLLKIQAQIWKREGEIKRLNTLIEKKVNSESLLDIEIRFLCFAINVYGSGQHPIATNKNINGFTSIYAMNCCENAILEEFEPNVEGIAINVIEALYR